MVYVSVSAKVGDASVTGIDGNDQPLIVESTSSGEYIVFKHHMMYTFHLRRNYCFI